MSEARSEKEYSQIENILSYIFGCNKGCKSRNTLIYTLYCGERGIRTPGTLRYNGFRDRHIRPLCHLSEGQKTKEKTLTLCWHKDKLLSALMQTTFPPIT